MVLLSQVAGLEEPPPAARRGSMLPPSWETSDDAPHAASPPIDTRPPPMRDMRSVAIGEYSMLVTNEPLPNNILSYIEDGSDDEEEAAAEEALKKKNKKRRATTRRPSGTASMPNLPPRRGAASSKDAPFMSQKKHALAQGRWGAMKASTNIGAPSAAKSMLALAIESIPHMNAAAEEESRLAFGRRCQLTDAVDALLSEARLPTPQFAARRELPPRNARTYPTVPLEEPGSYGWQPPKADRLEGYIYHEPGQRVRESLLMLEEWRRAGITGAAAASGRRRRAEPP